MRRSLMTHVTDGISHVHSMRRSTHLKSRLPAFIADEKSVQLMLGRRRR